MYKKSNFIKAVCFLSFLVAAIYAATLSSFADSFYTESEVRAMYDENGSNYIGQYTSHSYGGVSVSDVHLVNSDSGKGLKIDFGNFNASGYKHPRVVVTLSFELYNQNDEQVGFGSMPVAVSGTTPLTTKYSGEIPYDYLPARVEVSFESLFNYDYYQGNINAFEYYNSVNATPYRILPDNYNEVNAAAGAKVNVNADIDAKAQKPVTFKDKVKVGLVIFVIVLVLIGFITSTTCEFVWIDGRMHTIWRLK
jgi:hypothetical protein